MTTSIRYVTNTTGVNNSNVAVRSTGNDYQLLAFNILPFYIYGAESRILLEWTGVGKIIKIISLFIQKDGKIINLSEDATKSTISIDDTGKVITIFSDESQEYVVHPQIKMFLIVGNYED